ncbi:MAG TPA: ribonuclease HII [Patescibacteria group bacterium]|nr:ribonuclease HII [Patescibacteria group bacterium]
MTRPDFSFEKKLWGKNIKFVLGVDEVGRGAFAGPLVAAGVIFPKTNKITKRLSFLKDVNDSKLIKAPLRKKLALQIKKHALFWSIQEIDIQTINHLGIGRANKMAFRLVTKDLLGKLDKSSNYFLLSDGYPVKFIKKIGLKRQLGIIDGDKKSLTIAAASIIAKVHRDSIMRKLAKNYPHYKFSRNKGYGTKSHQEALRIHGLTEIHRTSFELTKFLS